MARNAPTRAHRFALLSALLLCACAPAATLAGNNPHEPHGRDLRVQLADMRWIPADASDTYQPLRHIRFVEREPRPAPGQLHRASDASSTSRSGTALDAENWSVGFSHRGLTLLRRF